MDGGADAEAASSENTPADRSHKSAGNYAVRPPGWTTPPRLPHFLPRAPGPRRPFCPAPLSSESLADLTRAGLKAAHELEHMTAAQTTVELCTDTT